MPRVYDFKQRPRQAYANYYQTYIERDVKLLVNLKDASLFEKFMKLLAGRVGQLMDYTSLANDVGVHETIKADKKKPAVAGFLLDLYNAVN